MLSGMRSGAGTVYKLAGAYTSEVIFMLMPGLDTEGFVERTIDKGNILSLHAMR